MASVIFTLMIDIILILQRDYPVISNFEGAPTKYMLQSFGSLIQIHGIIQHISINAITVAYDARRMCKYKHMNEVQIKF